MHPENRDGHGQGKVKSSQQAMTDDVLKTREGKDICHVCSASAGQETVGV